jgi:hypothetical protein
VHCKDKIVGNLAVQIIINLSVSNDNHVQERLIKANILDLVYSLLRDCRRSEFRKNGGLLFSNIMSWEGLILLQVYIEYIFRFLSILS